MTTPFSFMRSSKEKKTRLTLSIRVLFVLLICCIQLIYIPTSNRLSGGFEPKLPIDIFPIWPIWIVPYVLCYALWFSGFLWIIFNVEDRSFQAFIAACMLTFGMGVLTFIFFPTYIRAGTIQGNDIFASYLRFIHQDLGRYDAFPSGHVYITTLLMLFFNRWIPRRKFWWILILVIVSLSTLFTGQHYILDVVGGYIAALAGYHFGLWWAGFYSVQKGIDKRSGRRIPSSLPD